MVSAIVITIRETVEASLLIAVVLAVLAQDRLRRLRRVVWAGVAIAGAVSVLLGVALLGTVGALHGRAREGVEGVLMAVAVAILTYVLSWARQRSREVAQAIRAQVQAAAGARSALALLALVVLTVLREGAETVLYLSAAVATSSVRDVVTGLGIGLAGGAAIGYGVYHGGRRMRDVRRFFQATTIVLLAFAAGLVGRATLALQAAGVFPGTIAVWDTGGLLSDRSPLGAALSALVGYTARPSLLQLIFVLGYLALVLTISADPDRGTGFAPIGRDYTHPLYRVIRNRRAMRVAPAAMAVVFVALLAIALLGLDVGPLDNHGPLRLGSFAMDEDDNNLFEFVLWILWLPLLSLVTVVAARIWCGVLCPLRLVTDATRALADRLGLGRGSVTTRAMRLGWLLPSVFVLVTFVVKGLPVQQYARAGAVFFLVVIAAAAAAGFVFRQGTWCRYLCPVGGWLARVTRLSSLALNADPDTCATCKDKPCLTGTAAAGRCPVALNPPRLDSNQHCLACFNCVVNCPTERASLKLGWRVPSAELLDGRAPNLWESLFVAGLLGLYAAVGQRSQVLAGLPWPVRFFGLLAGATLLYLVVCALVAPLAGIGYRDALTAFGYPFLPFEFATALIAFGDDSFEFLRHTQPAAAVLLTLGFVWSVVLTVAAVRRHSRTPVRALTAAVPLSLALVGVLFVWLHWYAGGTVVDLT
jgi:high-affinity iron transporter